MQMSSWSFSRAVADTEREHGEVFRYCSLGVCCLSSTGLHAKQPATHFVSRPEWWLILLKVMANKFICNRALLCVRPTLGGGKTLHMLATRTRVTAAFKVLSRQMPAKTHREVTADTVVLGQRTWVDVVKENKQEWTVHIADVSPSHAPPGPCSPEAHRGPV